MPFESDKMTYNAESNNNKGEVKMRVDRQVSEKHTHTHTHVYTHTHTHTS